MVVVTLKLTVVTKIKLIKLTYKATPIVFSKKVNVKVIINVAQVHTINNNSINENVVALILSLMAICILASQRCNILMVIIAIMLRRLVKNIRISKKTTLFINFVTVTFLCMLLVLAMSTITHQSIQCLLFAIIFVSRPHPVRHKHEMLMVYFCVFSTANYISFPVGVNCCTSMTWKHECTLAPHLCQ